MFKNKVVLVTGSSRGIGRSIAVSFAKLGANVVVNYKNSKTEAENVLKILQTYGNDCMCVKADVSKDSEVKSMVNEIIKKYGKIDVLVNNAGIAIDKDFNNRKVSDWNSTMGTNLIGAFLVSKYVGREMLKQKQGKIINVSSTNGLNTNYPYSIDYDASKASLISLTKNLAIQFAPYINVNAIAPGWVDTDMNAELSSKYLEEEKSKILLGRFGTPEEISHLVVFLASQYANYIDGEVIKVSGGL